jgi:hypothetical protein
MLEFILELVVAIVASFLVATVGGILAALGEWLFVAPPLLAVLLLWQIWRRIKLAIIRYIDQ